jgi:hypothetical protein
MPSLLPPAWKDLVHNARLLAEDWRGRGGLARWYMFSQLLSTALTALCAIGASLALALEDWGLYLGLLLASALSLAHTLGTWRLLRRRYLVRYQLW